MLPVTAIGCHYQGYVQGVGGCVHTGYTMGPGIPSPRYRHKVGSHQNMYGLQAGGRHPTGMLFVMFSTKVKKFSNRMRGGVLL